MGRSRPTSVLLIALASSMAAACGHSAGTSFEQSPASSADGGASVPASVPAVCEDYGATIYASGCDVLNDPSLKDEQVARLAATCAAALAAPGMNADAATTELTACLARMKNEPACDVSCFVGAAGEGSRVVGEPCMYGGQCQGYCKTSARATCGVCADFIAKDQPCLPASELCAAGLACQPQGAQNWTCQPAPVSTSKQEGDSCQLQSQCADGLICTTTSGNADRTCQRTSVLGLGASCLSTTATCDRRLVCAFGKCALPAFGDPGATCDRTHACKRGTCDGSEGTGTCPDVKEEGEACSDLAPCDTYLACIAGTCAIPDPSTCH
jgi:hypothetical protein